MIPKKIHYCWFGRNPKPQLAKKCINSWKKYCKDYELVEWNEENFDIASAPLYVRQAYEAKKWAFVTDYVRLWAMVNYGGIYMDTDVEVIKPLDSFLFNQAFSGFEDEMHIPTGIMACEKNFPLFIEFLHYYDNIDFYSTNRNNTTITNVTIITEICISKGLNQNNKLQNIDGLTLYPKDYFCPINYSTGYMNKTANTTTIHWFSGSWHSKKDVKMKKYYRRKGRKWVRKQQLIIVKDKIKHIPNYFFMTILGEKYETIKNKLKK